MADTNPLADLGATPTSAANPLGDLGAVPVAATAGPAPDHSTFQELADDLKQGGIGALKTTGRTAANLMKVASWVLGTDKATSPTLDWLKTQIGEPQGTAQTVGGVLADVGTAMLPAGEIDAATEAAQAAVRSPALKTLARIATQAAAGGATSAVQGQSPAVGAVLGGGVSALTGASSAVAPALDRGAENSMIRALGPAGGRGPTSAANLASAEALAPDLVKQGFMPMSAAAARAQAKTAVTSAAGDLKGVLGSAAGDEVFDQPSLLQKIQAKRDALKIDPGNGQTPFVPTDRAAVDALYANVQRDVERLGDNPSNRAVHALKKQWNDIVADFSSDPAAGSQKDVYTKAGNLVRAQLGTDAPTISAADQAFHKASALQDIVTAPNVRRPGAGMSAMLSPYAKPVVGATAGAALGYQQDGATGAVAGALTGAALGHVIQSPGFRYISSALKAKLADALQAGESAKVSQLISTIARLTPALARANQAQP